MRLPHRLAAVCLVGALAAPAQANDTEEIIIVGAICGLGLAATAGVAGGLATWENGAAKDTRRAANAYRAVPSQQNARLVASKRADWQDAHDFNSTDDTYAWAVGLTGVLAGSMCLGVFASVVE